MYKYSCSGGNLGSFLLSCMVGTVGTFSVLSRPLMWDYLFSRVCLLNGGLSVEQGKVFDRGMVNG